MHSSGLTNAPITKLLLIYLLTSSIALSIFDIKHLASIHVSPHLWPYAQFWRALTWQMAGFTNSTEALFAAMLVYHCRVVERAWGKRKIVTFILSTLPYTTLLPPILLVCILRPLSWGYLNYLPSGPTGVVFALLAQYYASIPHTFRFRIATSSSAASAASKPPQDTSSPSAARTTRPNPGNYLTLLLSDKSLTYLVAGQLALSQFPAMLLPATVGWFVGLAWRADMLPGASGAGRRVPAWVVGEREEARRVRNGTAGRYEDLRRRLEGEVVAASGSGSGSEQGQGQVHRRNTGGGLMERLRGAF